MEDFAIVVCSNYYIENYLTVICLVCDNPCYTKGSKYSLANEVIGDEVDISHLKTKYFCKNCMINLAIQGGAYLVSLDRGEESKKFLNSVDSMLSQNAKNKKSENQNPGEADPKRDH